MKRDTIDILRLITPLLGLLAITLTLFVASCMRLQDAREQARQFECIEQERTK